MLLAQIIGQFAPGSIVISQLPCMADAGIVQKDEIDVVRPARDRLVAQA